MGKINKFVSNEIITKQQNIILKEFQKDQFLTSTFYFTGGTALSYYYLKHRYSVDLDFFSLKPFDPQIILNKLSAWGRIHHFMPKLKNIENVYSFNLNFSDKSQLKLDFVNYPYRQIKKAQVIDQMQIDSLTDIAINKVSAVIQRTEVKDYVDLYFILKHQQFTIWDLIEGVRIKFRFEIDPLVLGSDLMVVEKFDFLPRMIKPLKLESLKEFFLNKAKQLGRRAVEK